MTDLSLPPVPHPLNRERALPARPLYMPPRIDDEVIDPFLSGHVFKRNESMAMLQTYSLALLCAHRYQMITTQELDAIPDTDPLPMITQLLDKADGRMIAKLYANMDDYHIDRPGDQASLPDISFSFCTRPDYSLNPTPDSFACLSCNQFFVVNIDSLFSAPPTVQFTVYYTLALIDQLLVPISLPHEYRSGEAQFSYLEIIEVFNDYRDRGWLNDEEGIAQAQKEYHENDYDNEYGDFEYMLDFVMPFLEPQPVWMDLPNGRNPQVLLDAVESQLALWNRQRDPVRLSWWACYVYRVITVIKTLFPSRRNVQAHVRAMHTLLNTDSDSSAIYRGLYVNDGSGAFSQTIEDIHNYVMQVGEAPEISFTLEKIHRNRRVAETKTLGIIEMMSHGLGLLTLADEVNEHARKES
jgi:hypothetical protein